MRNGGRVTGCTEIQSYFVADVLRRPRTWAKTVRVPKRQAVSRGAIAQMRDAIWAVLAARESGREVMSQVSYGQLDKVLRGLGFSCRTANLQTEALVYEHQETGAVIILPAVSQSMGCCHTASRLCKDSGGLCRLLDLWTLPRELRRRPSVWPPAARIGQATRIGHAPTAS